MAYTDVNTPVIEKIKLPSGNDYYIADRELRDVVDTLSDTVAGGVSYNVAWDGTSTPVVANIPKGVVVTYNNQTYTGTLEANNATPGAFYLVKSSTLPSGETLDIYEEYVPVGSAGNKTWEKLGDTKVDLSDVVTDVSLTKQTDTVIGTDATFTITQPTVSLSAENTTDTGRVGVIQSVDTSKKLSASASGAGVAWNAKDAVTAVTGYPNTTTADVASSVTPTTKKLATTTVTGVSGSTTASKATATTSQTTADGTGTASTTNTDWLKGVSVSNGVLTIGAATMDTQTTTQFTFADVTVPTAAASATTVATGATTTTGSGADIVTDVAVGDTVAAITALGTPSTKSAIGASATFTVTQPSVTIASGSTGDVTYVSGGTTKYIAASASGANTAWNSKDSVTVLKSTTDVDVTKGS